LTIIISAHYKYIAHLTILLDFPISNARQLHVNVIHWFFFLWFSVVQN